MAHWQNLPADKIAQDLRISHLRTLEITGYKEGVDGDRFCILPGSGFLLNQKIRKVVEVSRPWTKHLSQEFRETITWLA